jgi:transcriptional regulator with XRE-family HTH domain
VREARELTVEQIASRLMLSKSQVLGLERADASSFYNSAYFLRGLRRYMAFAGVPEDELNESLEEDQEDDGFRLMLAEPVSRTPVNAPGPALSWRTVQVAAAAAVVTVLGIGAYRTFPAATSGPDTVALEASALLPSYPTMDTQMAQPAARPVPTSGTEPADTSTVRISVGKPTWVFIRYPDDRVIERRLEAGEALQVGPLPVYLALGTADSVELRVEDRPVSLTPFIKDGQVRITRPELAKLIP